MTESEKRKIDFSSYSKIVIFLLLEVFAFITFSFGNSFLLYSILGIIITLLLLLVSYYDIKKVGTSRLLFFVFPLFSYGLITAISNYSKVNIYIPTVDKVFIPIALLMFATCGSIMSVNKDFKLSTALTVIYSTLSVITLINLFITMIRFVPFYTLIYKDGYIYYGGVKSNDSISNIAYALIGYQFKEVSVGHFSLTPSILLTSVIGLFYIHPKKETSKFVLYCFFVLTSLISIIFVPSKLTLLSTGLIVLVLLIILLKAKNIIPSKGLKIALLVVLSLGVLGLIIVFLNAQNWSFVQGLKDLIKSNSLTNKIFNANDYIVNINDILCDLFSSNKLFGFYFSNILIEKVAIPSNSFFFDNLITSGLFGALFFLIGFIYGINGLIKYMKYSKEEDKNKYLLLSLIISYFIYISINGDVKNLTFFNTYNFAFFTGPFLLVITLLGYASHLGHIDYEEFMKNKEKTDENKA